MVEGRDVQVLSPKSHDPGTRGVRMDSGATRQGISFQVKSGAPKKFISVPRRHC